MLGFLYFLFFSRFLLYIPLSLFLTSFSHFEFDFFWSESEVTSTFRIFLIRHPGNQHNLRRDTFLSIIWLGSISVRLALTHCLRVDDTPQAAEFDRKSIATLGAERSGCLSESWERNNSAIRNFLFYRVAFGSISRTRVRMLLNAPQRPAWNDRISISCPPRTCTRKRNKKAPRLWIQT